MRRFCIGFVDEYVETPEGYRVLLDMGEEALLALDNPIAEHCLNTECGADLFDKNLGAALHVDASGRALWHPARIGVVLMGAAFVREGRMIGMEHWSPPSAPLPKPEGRNPFLSEGTISLTPASGAAAWHIYGDLPDYERAGALLKELVGSILITAGEHLFTGAEADRSLLKDLKPRNGTAFSLPRIDFAYAEGGEILHIQRSICPAQDFPRSPRA